MTINWSVYPQGLTLLLLSSKTIVQYRNLLKAASEASKSDELRMELLARVLDCI